MQSSFVRRTRVYAVGEEKKLWSLNIVLSVGNSSVVKIYIISSKPGPVAKNVTPRPSGRWESNPRPLDY